MKLHSLGVRDLVKRYEGFHLGPLAFDLAPGRACGLLGPNGSGKTTLLNCLAGQVRPDAGEILWNGRDIPWGDWRYREEISFTLETPILYEDLSIGQTLRFASSIYATWDGPFALDWLAKMKLDPKKRVRALSKGMRVKLSLIAGLAHGAKLLLLDEPTAGLDPDARADIQELLRNLVRERQACLMISSHLFEDIESVCDDLIILRQGRITLTSAIRTHDLQVPASGIRNLYFSVSE